MDPGLVTSIQCLLQLRKVMNNQPSLFPAAICHWLAVTNVDFWSSRNSQFWHDFVPHTVSSFSYRCCLGPVIWPRKTQLFSATLIFSIHHTTTSLWCHTMASFIVLLKTRLELRPHQQMLNLKHVVSSRLQNTAKTWFTVLPCSTYPHPTPQQLHSPWAQKAGY